MAKVNIDMDCSLQDRPFGSSAHLHTDFIMMTDLLDTRKCGEYGESLRRIGVN